MTKLKHLEDVKEQVKLDHPDLEGSEITKKVLEVAGFKQSHLWKAATREGWVIALRVVCPPVASRQEGYRTQGKVRAAIQELMGHLRYILDVYISLYNEGQADGIFITTAYIRIMAQNINYALNLMNAFNHYQVGNHQFSCTLETNSTRDWQSSKRAHAPEMTVWNLVMVGEAPEEAHKKTTDKQIIQECNGRNFAQKVLEQVQENFNQHKSQLLALEGKAQSSAGGTEDGKWVWAEEVEFLKKAPSYQCAKMWLKDKDARGVGNLTKLIIQAQGQGALMCFNAMQAVCGDEEILNLQPGDKVLALPTIDDSLILRMTMEEERAHYLVEVPDEAQKQNFKDGKGVLAYIGIQYIIAGGMIQVLDCGFAFAGALEQSSQLSDERILIKTLKNFLGKWAIYTALKGERNQGPVALQDVMDAN